MMVITAPAIIKLSCCPASSIKLYRPTAIGRHSGELVTNKGQAKEFHEPIKDNTTITITGALESGSTVVIRNRRCPAP